MAALRRRSAMAVSLLASPLSRLIAWVVLWCAVGAQAADAPGGVVVNGQTVPADHVRALEQAYRVAIVPGRYWYDAMSGAWGQEGGPIAGQMMPGLRLG